MSSLLLILLSSVLVSYFAIHNVSSLQPFYSDDTHDCAVGIAIVTALNLAVLAPLCWLLDEFVLRALHVDYLAAVLFLAVVLILVLLSERFLERQGRWLPQPGFLLTMTAQSVLLGVPLLSRVRSGTIVEAAALGVGAGVSFALLLLVFSSMQLRLRAANIPAPFRQAPISLITLGIMALAVMGFTGLIRE